MKLKWALLSVLMSTAMLLAACNDEEDKIVQEDNQPEQQQPEQNPEQQPEQNPEQQPAGDDSEQTTDGENADEASNEEPVLRGDEANLTFTLNGEKVEEKGYLTESEQQNYSLYKLDGYELTGEEPNKDALFSVENDSVFMRIETISDEEADYEIILNNMVQTMGAIAIGDEPEKITDEAKLPTGEGIQNAAGYEVEKEIGTISGYVFQRGDLIIRLTIFDRNTSNLTDALLKMGETIAEK